jgi:glycosyltransferase involved in cell wall biosynthesis
MKKILYVKHSDSTFIKIDQRILEKQYRVVPFLINQNKQGFSFLKRMLNLLFFLFWNAPGSVAMVTWFGDYHAALMVFVGKLTRTRVIIFAGGQEAICYPELKKGVYYKKWRGTCVKFALKNAALIIPNHSSLVFHQNFYYSPDGKKDGISHYIPGIRTPIQVIPNGIDTGRFYRDSKIPKVPASILTVGTMSSRADFINKGFDLFTEMARRNSDLRFTLIGIKKEFIPWIEENYRISEVSNLHLIFSYCPEEVLLMNYNKAKVFVQASITEGMPNTLNEAMLCECIPVGSNVNGIPDAIGDTGIIVLKRSVLELEKAVYQALNLKTGTKARNHVLEHFSLEKREEKILKVLKEQNLYS